MKRTAEKGTFSVFGGYGEPSTALLVQRGACRWTP